MPTDTCNITSPICDYKAFCAATTPYPASGYEDLEDAIDYVEELAIHKLDALAKKNEELCAWIGSLKRDNAELNSEVCYLRYNRRVDTPDPNKVTITIDRKDAGILARVTDRIGGAPGGPRGAIDRVRIALALAGVPPRADYSDDMYPFADFDSIYLVEHWR